MRPMACGSSGHGNNLGILNRGDWQLSTNYQYFKSFRHFRGDHEEANRVADGTEVINHSHTLEFSATTGLTNRIGLTFALPYQNYSRSSLYEHYGNSTNSNPNQVRFSTYAQGMGDARVTMNYWLWNPGNDSLRGNISIGGGIKLPTGQSNVLGEFHKIGSDGGDSVAVRPVDQSIQLGDGSWGINLEAQGFTRLFKGGWLYFNGFYLLTPREVNNTLRRGEFTNRELQMDYLSVPDQYAARLGLSYSFWRTAGLSIRCGARAEGVPAKDLIGGSEGYRRPGHIVSAEPGLGFMRGQWSVNIDAPIALYRNRVKSVWDMSDPTGERHGDAAFADYLLSISLIYRPGGKLSAANQPPQAP